MISMDFLTTTYLSTFINIAILNFIALISPGPDFAIVVKNSLIHSKKAGMVTVLGIVLGVIIHLTYIILGVGVIIAKNIWVLHGIKLLGILYLTSIGIKMMLVKADAKQTHLHLQQNSTTSCTQAFQSGLFANLLNPKAILFFIGIFTIVVDYNTPLIILCMYALAIILTTLVWFSIVAHLFSIKKIRDKFLNIKHWVEKFTGGMLILISIKLAISKEY